MSLRKRAASLLCVLALALGFASAVQQPAQADAQGCDSWAAFTWGSLPTPVPGGFLCHYVKGSGRTITEEHARFSAHSSFCNWRIDFRYFDTSGRNYKTLTGPTNGWCTLSNSRTYYADQTLPYNGKACAYLYTNGIYVTKQCHSIF